MIEQRIRDISGIKYYAASHPRVRKYYRQGNRPREFGSKVWATTLVVLERLSQEEKNFSNLKVLEIGCGWGLLGIFLAKKFSCRVTASDLDKNVLPLVEMQAKINNVHIETKVSSFNELSTRYLTNFDLVIGSEICYSDEVAEDLRKLIERCLAAKVGKIILADPGRPDFKELMLKLTTSYKVQVEILPGSANGKKTYLLSIEQNLQEQELYEEKKD